MALLHSQTRRHTINKNTTCYRSIYTMEDPDLAVSNFMKNSIGLEMAKIHITFVG